MTDNQQLARYQAALEFATRKHAGQKRKGGEDYITHPVAVASILQAQGFDLDHQIAALFHDLLEDTDATEQEIIALGGETVLHAVKLLTKEKGYAMADYISRIKAHPMAMAVKSADRLHNLICAKHTNEAFRRKYIADTRTWYIDFSPEICQALADLEETL